ncbi:MAG TPA: hypothetical protein VGJ82_17500 [Thermoanaerobaculia bacterium]
MAIAIMLLLLSLRAVTSQPAVVIEGSRTLATTARPNLPMTAVGTALLVPMIMAQPALAFVFILCDMNGFGAYFDLDQWGVAGLFKFRDLEMAILLVAAMVFWMTRPRPRSMRPTRLRRYLRWVAVVIPALALIYTIFTLRVQDLATTVRYSRQFYVWLLILAAPQFIRVHRDVERAVMFLTAYVGLAAALYVAQSLAPPQTILRYSQQMPTGEQTRIWAPSTSAIFVGGMAVFAFLLQTRRRSRVFLWMIFAACAVAVVMSQARMFAGVFFLAIGIMLVHRAIVTHRVGLAVRVAATAVAILVTCAALLWAANRLDPLVQLWNRRFGELELDVRAHEGSWTARVAMFRYLPQVRERNGGGIFASFFGMGLRALTPSDLAPMTFWGDVSPPIWPDNGLAGITFAAGYFGLAMVILFVVATFWRLTMQFAAVKAPACRSITLAAVLFFTFALPLMFFSSSFLGVWDDALAVVVLLIMAERSAAIQKQLPLMRSHA